MTSTIKLVCIYCGGNFTAPKNRAGRPPGFCCDDCRRLAAALRAGTVNPGRKRGEFDPRAGRHRPGQRGAAVRDDGQPTLFDGMLDEPQE